MGKEITIIIPTLNTTGDKEQDKKIDYSLTQCLKSLSETVPDTPVVIASNGGEPKYIPEYLHPNTTRINVWEQGQCKAVNAAVATTNTDLIMVTNDDMIYPSSWLEKLIPILIPCNNNMEFCISAKLVEPNDGAPTFIKHFCGGAGGDFDKDKFLNFVAENKVEEWKTGFNLPFIMERKLWNKIGGYDINYDPWSSNSDSDLEYKIKLAGVQPVQAQSFLVYHFSQTSGTFNPEHRKEWNNNFKYFEEKWGFPRTDDGIWTADFEIDYKKLKFRPKWMKIPQNN